MRRGPATSGPPSGRPLALAELRGAQVGFDLEQGTAAPSNLDFDATLKRRNLEWGLRNLEEVTQIAALHGLQRQQVVRMPANNLTVVFAKTL